MKQNSPYIVCHMVELQDGRIGCHTVDKISGDEYYETLKALKNGVVWLGRKPRKEI